MNKTLICFLIFICSYLNSSSAQSNKELLDTLNKLSELEHVMKKAVDVNEAKEEAIAYIKLIETLSKDYRAEAIPVLLFRAGDVSTGIGAFDQAIDLWEHLVEAYPDHELKARAIFFQGFVLDTKQQKYDEARQKYEYFLSNFPKHELNSSARMLWSQLGSSDADLLNKIKSDN